MFLITKHILFRTRKLLQNIYTSNIKCYFKSTHQPRHYRVKTVLTQSLVPINFIHSPYIKSR